MEASSRRIPSLVQLCQRVAAANVDSISSLGDDLPYQLVKPILERCDATQLTRFETASPHLQEDTQEIWKQLCYSVYSLVINQYLKEEGQPACWKDCYYNLQQMEMERLEHASNKLRSQRHDEEVRKREREVKITDRIPPAKRPKWGMVSQPKTLFQKTRSEASRIQKSIYSARMVPPMAGGKTFRVLPTPPDISLGASGASSRVTVTTVLQRRSDSKATADPSSSTQKAPPAATPPTSQAAIPKPTPKKPPSEPNSPLKSQPRPVQPPLAAKRDPMACLFVPKHRAHSQRP